MIDVDRLLCFTVVRKMGAVLRSDNFDECVKIVVRSINKQSVLSVTGFVRFVVRPVVAAPLFANDAKASVSRSEHFFGLSEFAFGKFRASH